MNLHRRCVANIARGAKGSESAGGSTIASGAGPLWLTITPDRHQSGPQSPRPILSWWTVFSSWGLTQFDEIRRIQLAPVAKLPRAGAQGTMLTGEGSGDEQETED